MSETTAPTSEEPKAKPAAKPKAEKPKREPKPKAEPKGGMDDYDCDDLIKQAKERKRKAKAAAEKRKDAPKKSQATKNKEAVEKTSKRVEANVEKRAKKGDITAAEIEKLIAEYEKAIAKLKDLLKKAKSEKKMALGGNLGMDYSSAVGKITSDACKCGDKYANGGKVKPKMVRSQFEEEEFEYGNGGEILSFEKTIKDAMKQENKWHFINEMVDGKRVQLKMFVGKKEVDVQIFKIDGLGARMPKNYAGKRETFNMIIDNFQPKMAKGGTTDVSADRKYSAMKAGRRIGKKVSTISMSDGSKFKRRNKNQYGQAGGGEYYESRTNRSDRRKTL